jgi:iron complex outermembrane recepter protein
MRRSSVRSQRSQRIGPVVRLFAAVLCAGMVSAAPAAVAQQGSASAVVEEIVVTAQKRPERLQDVPLAITAISGDRMSALSVQTLEQINALTPNVRVSSAPGVGLLFVRGVGSGTNLAFEQSVGTFIDGVYFGRDRAARAAMFDVERVEVLKGPQVTLFGKNTIGGAFSFVTRDPGDSFESYVEGNYDFELDSRGVESAVSGPVTDKLAIRLAGRYQDQRGWVQNPGTGVDGGSRKDRVARAVFVADPTDALRLRLKVERNSFELGPDPIEIAFASPEYLELVRSLDPAEDGIINHRKSGPGFQPGFDQEFEKTDSENYTLALDWYLGDFNVTAISSFVGYEIDKAADVDISALSRAAVTFEQDYQAVAQEVRLLSPEDMRLTYIVGAYYSDESYDSAKYLDVNLPELGLSGFPVLRRSQTFDLSTETWSAYGQGNFVIAGPLSITAGLRYSSVRKSARQLMHYSDFGEVTPNPELAPIGSLLGLGPVHDFGNLRRKDDHLSFTGRLEYQTGAGLLAYAGYSRGYKAGGFDEDNAAGFADGQEFAEEQVDAFEVGVKSRLGAGILNIAAFYNKLEDLQVASFNANLNAFTVTNAASATSRGVEVELQQKLTDRLDILLNGAFLDAFFKDYRNAQGYFGSVIDRSGDRLPFSSKWQVSTELRHAWHMTSDWWLMSRVLVGYNSAYDTSLNPIPELRQSGYVRVDARVALEGERVELAFIGRNLTDRKIKSYGNEIPLSGNANAGIPPSLSALSEPPRTLALQLRVNF